MRLEDDSRGRSRREWEEKREELIFKLSFNDDRQSKSLTDKRIQ